MQVQIFLIKKQYRNYLKLKEHENPYDPMALFQAALIYSSYL